MAASKSVWWKAQLLSNGICIDESLLDNYDASFIEKRSAYGIQDPSQYRLRRIPQELIIKPENIVCAVNIKPESDYILYYSKEEQDYYVKHDNNVVNVSFPKRPEFYNKCLTNNPLLKANQVITLYGGHSLGAFLIRNCWIEKNGVCHFCSLCNNHTDENDFLNTITDDVLEDSIRIALDEKYPITQIMLNGGNLPDLNDNFNYYANRVLKVRKLLDELKRDEIELHLIVSPPKDLQLIERLKSQNIKIAMNMETYDDELFAKYCPGKQKHIGHDHIRKALIKCVKELGKEHVYSIFVGGLEPLESLEKGISDMSQNDIVPVINVLHIDPNTKMEERQKPSPDFILNAGAMLQDAYSKYSNEFRPFYYQCGRNSLDSEAYQQLF